MTKKKDWFSIKSYIHIGLPITWKDCTKVKKYITNPKNIESHSFCPFIHTQIRTPKFRKEYDSKGNLRLNGKRVADKPKKEIFIMPIIGMQIFLLIIPTSFLSITKIP